MLKNPQVNYNLTQYTPKEIANNEHLSIFGRMLNLFKYSPKDVLFCRTKNTPLNTIFKQRNLTEWRIAQEDFEDECVNTKLPEKDKIFLGAVEKSLNAIAQDKESPYLKNLQPGNIAKLVAGLIDNEEELQFVFENYNTLRTQAGGAPLNLEIIKKNIQNKDVQQNAEALISAIAKDHLNAQDVTTNLKNAFVGNMAFEVVFLAGTLIFGQTFVGFLIAGAFADIAVNMGSGFFNGVCDALNKKSLISLIKDPIAGFIKAYQDRANDPNSLHPFWDTLGVSFILTAIIEVQVKNIYNVQKYFPGLFQFFYPFMNLVLISKTALEKGEFLTARNFANLAVGFATGYLRGLLKEATFNYINTHFVQHIQHAWKDDVMNFILKEAAIIPITVLTASIESLFSIFLFPSIANDFNWLRGKNNQPKQKTD